MANVDDIFKNVGGSSKRKLEEARDGDIAPRATKLHRIQNDDEDLKAGPELPPEDDDDEEGRFFGGGISKQQADALDYVDSAGDDQGPEKIDLAWLHRKAQNLERKMAKNVEMRTKYEKYPQKFEDSEYSLKLEIMGLSILTEYPELYPEFTKLGFPGHMVGLLAHENTDIVVDVLDVIDELTDENVSTTTYQWDSLVDSLFEADLASLLVSNLGRLGEDEEADRSGALKVLSIVENLCSRPSAANRLAREGSLAEWMIQRIQRREDAVSQTKQYSAEVLAIMSQSSAHLRHRLAALDSADILLQLVAIYRKIDPEKGSFEEEYCKNLFEILTCLVTEPAGKDKFVEAEGVALCLIMFKHGKMSKLPALRLMDCAASGTGGAVVCLRLVNDNGLKPLFTLFMRTHDSRQLYHLIGILASMLQHLPIDSDERIRLLAKLVENDYEKTAKLLRLRRLYVGRVKAVEAKHGNGTFEDLDAERSDLRLLTRLLEAGLYSLQQVDASLAWLVAEDQGARNKIESMLAEQGQDLSTLAATLEQKRAALKITDTDSQEMGDMLGTLLEFLR